MMRCPICGPRPDAEFRRMRRKAHHGRGRLVPVTLWVHQRSTCREIVYLEPATALDRRGTLVAR